MNQVEALDFFTSKYENLSTQNPKEFDDQYEGFIKKAKLIRNERRIIPFISNIWSYLTKSSSKRAKLDNLSKMASFKHVAFTSAVHPLSLTISKASEYNCLIEPNLESFDLSACTLLADFIDEYIEAQFRNIAKSIPADDYPTTDLSVSEAAVVEPA